MFRTVFNSIAIIILIILVVPYLRNKFDKTKDFSNVSDNEVVSILVVDPQKVAAIGDLKLTVKVVNSPESTRLGLSGREEIGNDGMLFLFPEKSIRNFWMKEMKFDLDIVWINGNEIVGISSNVKKPEPNAEINDLKLVSIGQNTDKVLELNAGDVEKYRIQVGNVVILK